MSKPESYFDWQLTFKKNNDQINNRKSNNNNENKNVIINSLGIPDYEFEAFMKNWKKKTFEKNTKSVSRIKINKKFNKEIIEGKTT